MLKSTLPPLSFALVTALFAALVNLVSTNHLTFAQYSLILFGYLASVFLSKFSKLSTRDKLRNAASLVGICAVLTLVAGFADKHLDIATLAVFHMPTAVIGGIFTGLIAAGGLQLLKGPKITEQTITREE